MGSDGALYVSPMLMPQAMHSLQVSHLSGRKVPYDEVSDLIPVFHCWSAEVNIWRAVTMASTCILAVLTVSFVCARRYVQ